MAKNWERRKTEGEEAFAAFACYRDQLPPRRLFSVRVAGIAVDQTKLAQWAKQHDWVSRTASYDEHLDEVRRTAREGALALNVADLTVRHVGILAELSEVVQAEVSKFKMRVKDGSIAAMKPGEMIKAIEQLVKLDRLVAGETTENITTTLDFSKMTEEEVLIFSELYMKAQRDPEK